MCPYPYVRNWEIVKWKTYTHDHHDYDFQDWEVLRSINHHPEFCGYIKKHRNF